MDHITIQKAGTAIATNSSPTHERSLSVKEYRQGSGAGAEPPAAGAGDFFLGLEPEPEPLETKWSRVRKGCELSKTSKRENNPIISFYGTIRYKTAHMKSKCLRAGLIFAGSVRFVFPGTRLESPEPIEITQSWSQSRPDFSDLHPRVPHFFTSSISPNVGLKPAR